MINALEHLSTQNGTKPDVIQAKRECFQKLIRYMTQARRGGGSTAAGNACCTGRSVAVQAHRCMLPGHLLPPALTCTPLVAPHALLAGH